MTQQMQSLMYLYAAGARGVSATLPQTDTDWTQVLALARQQGIYNDVAYAACKLPQDAIPQTLRAQLHAHLLGACLHRTRQTEAIVALLGKLQAAQLHPVLLKGPDAARLYACPEARICADTDILVPPQEECAALELLRAQGFRVQPRRPEQNQTDCSHPRCGLVELHISLFSSAYADTIFARALPQVQTRQVQLPEGVIPVLAAPQAVCFLAMHMIKHFLPNGMNLRMLMDYGLASAACAPRERVLTADTMQTLGFAPLLAAVNGVLTRYLGFTQDELPPLPPCSDEQARLLADDLETGCYEIDKKDKARLESWLLLRNHRLRAGSMKNRRAIARLDAAERHRVMFPPHKRLAERYPILNQYAWLYPIMWIDRLASGVVSRLFGKSGRKTGNAAETHTQPDAAQLRIGLLRKLGVE